MKTPEHIEDLLGRPLSELTGYLAAEDFRLRADAACVIGDMVRDMPQKELPGATIEALEKLLTDGQPAVRLEAAITLSLLHRSEAAPVLRDLTNYKNMRLDAIYALGRMGDQEAIPLLQGMLVRILLPWADKLQAAAALTMLGDSCGQDYLVSRLQARRYLERAAACHFIGEGEHPRAFEILSKIAADEKSAIRDTAIRSLGLIADERAEDFLCDLYDTVSLTFQNDVVSALTSLQGRKKIGERAKKILSTSGN